MGTKTHTEVKSFRRYNLSAQGVRSVSTLSATCTRTRTGSVDPLWRLKVKSGANATNPFTASSEMVSYNPGRTRLVVREKTSPDYLREYYSSSGLGFLDVPTTAVDTFFKAEVENHALIAIINRIRSQDGMYSLPIILVELRKTIKGCIKPAAALRAFANKFLKDAWELERLRKMSELTGKRGDYHKRRLTNRKRKVDADDRDFSKALASSWLEFSFHAKPLAATIADALDESIPRYRDLTTRKMVGKRWIEKKSVTSTYSNGLNGTPLVVSWDVDTIQECSVKYRVCIHKAWSADCGFTTLTERVGHTLTHSRSDVWEIIPAVWEAIPFSWLADYFVNLGQIFGTNFDYNANVSWICKTVRAEKSVVYRPRGFVNNNPAHSEVLEHSPESMVGYRKSVDRTAPTSLGVPKLEFRLPGENSQFLNMAAVARQFINLKSRRSL